VESQSGLGIYISKKQAHAILVKRGKVTAGFSVQADPDESNPLQAVVRGIGQGCTERNFRFSDVAVAVDTSLFMQHRIHSEFSSPKQIAQTIRFDTEEAVATDIASLAVGFDLIRTGEHGSDLNVFTAEHGILSDIVLTLQGYGIDPVNIVPDVACLARMIPLCANHPGLDEQSCLYSVLSAHNGYFLASSGADLLPVRAFLVGNAKNKTDLLMRETFTTRASSIEAVDTLVVFDATGSVDAQALGPRLGLETLEVDWFNQCSAGMHAQQAGEDPIDYAIAYGAILFAGEKSHSLSFRNDFMPHQGKQLRQRSALKWICVSIMILLLALGGRLQAKWYGKRQDANAIREKLGRSYSRVMKGNEMPKNPVPTLAGAIRSIEAKKDGRISSGNQSTTGKLQLVIKAIHTCYTRSKLDIDKISIGASSISINGSSGTSIGRIQFNDELKKMKLGATAPHFGDPKGGRYPLSISIKTKTQQKAK
jgi:hypothetical protein